MAKKRVYTPEFRAKIIELIRSGKNANVVLDRNTRLRAQRGVGVTQPV